MLEKVKKICFNIATLGGLGEWILGGIAATVLAAPAVLLLNSLSWFGPLSSLMAIAGLALIAIIAIQIGLNFESDKDSSVIVLDRFFGFLLVFLGIPFGIKFMLVGLILFNILNFLRPFLLVRFANINLDALPGVVGIMAGDIVVGLSLNLFFRFVLWLAH